MTARGSAREQPLMLQAAPEHRICRPSQPHPGSGNLRQIGGSARVLRGSRGHSAFCRPPTSMPVEPALTALLPQDRSSGLHGPALPDMDFRNRASSNFSPNIVSESGSTNFVEVLVRLQAEAAGDDFFLDLGGAAEDRLHTAKPPELTIAAQSSRLVLPLVKAGSIGSARAAAFARRELGGDHAPGDRLTAWQLPEPRRGPGDHAEPAAADIPAVDADVDCGELIAAQLPQVLMMHDASDGSQVRSCSGEPPCGNQDLGRGQEAHHDSMGTGGTR